LQEEEELSLPWPKIQKVFFLNGRRFACKWWKVLSIEETIFHARRRCVQIQRKKKNLGVHYDDREA
jgi:hypothetical protein